MTVDNSVDVANSDMKGNPVFLQPCKNIKKSKCLYIHARSLVNRCHALYAYADADITVSETWGKKMHGTVTCPSRITPTI